MQQALDSLVGENEAVDGAFIATLDGTLCAQRVRNQQAVVPVAPLGGQFMALGDAITGALNMGECRNIIAENANGSVIFVHVTQDWYW